MYSTLNTQRSSKIKYNLYEIEYNLTEGRRTDKPCVLRFKVKLGKAYNKHKIASM